jgi:hypothetical protein
MLRVRLRYRTLKLRALCWALRRLRAGQRRPKVMRVEYKKAPDLATRKELCDQTRGRRSLAWEEAKPKRISNIQAKFRQSWRRRRRASPNTAIPFSSRKPD